MRAAQLTAYAQLLEADGGVEEAEGTSVIAESARALLSSLDCDTSVFIAVEWSSSSALHAVEKALRIRDGVDPAVCAVSGDGVTYYRAGDNGVVLAAVDGEGDVVESIQAADVCVRVEGASVAGVAVTQAGIVELVYSVPEGNVSPITVTLG